jgi:3-deoxy-D-manno-octulosonic-acid transferase
MPRQYNAAGSSTTAQYVMLIIYRFIYFFISWLLRLFFLIWPNSLQKWILLRNKKINIKPTSERRILIHAASGEIEYVKSVIRLIKVTDPKLEIYVSYSSPSAEKLFFNITDQVTQFIPLPWDQPKVISTFLKQLKPSVIVFSRTDFWPELICQAKLLNIPLVAVSLYPRFGLIQNIWLRFVLSKMSVITVVNPISETKLKTVVNSKVQIIYLADTRFDQVVHRLQSPSRFEVQTQSQTITFGSTWPEDEAIIFECLDQILGFGYQVIWSPHDVSPQRIEDLRQKITRYHVSIFSNLHSPFHFKSQILILDQVGFLADMYRYSQVAFIGGSFKSKVHSVMEPLCAGNPVLVGPFYKNNPEAVLFESLGYVKSVSHSRDFIRQLEIISKINKNQITQATQKMIGSSQMTAEIILSYMPQQSTTTTATT